MQREFGRWVRVIIVDPADSTRQKPKKNLSLLSARIMMSVGDGDEGGISRVLVGLKILLGVVT